MLQLNTLIWAQNSYHIMAEVNEKRPVESGEQDPSLQALPGAVDDAGAIPKGTIDPVYEAKARVLNHAVSAELIGRKPENGTDHNQIQEIGMGWYQWQLFIVVGFVGKPCFFKRHSGKPEDTFSPRNSGNRFGLRVLCAEHRLLKILDD